MSETEDELRQEINRLSGIVYKLTNLFRATCVFCDDTLSFDDTVEFHYMNASCIHCYEQHKCSVCHRVDCDTVLIKCCHPNCSSKFCNDCRKYVCICIECKNSECHSHHFDVVIPKSTMKPVIDSKKSFRQYQLKPFIKPLKYDQSCSNCRLKLMTESP